MVNRIIFGFDKICGYEYIVKFDFDSYFLSVLWVVMFLKNIFGNCLEIVEIMICFLFVLWCIEEIRGFYLFCRVVCYDYVIKC